MTFCIIDQTSAGTLKGRPTASMIVSVSDYMFVNDLRKLVILVLDGGRHILQRQQLDSQQPGRPQTAFVQRGPESSVDSHCLGGAWSLVTRWSQKRPAMADCCLRSSADGGTPVQP